MWFIQPAPRVGIEPTLTGLESVVLPLDEQDILGEAPRVVGQLRSDSHGISLHSG